MVNCQDSDQTDGVILAFDAAQTQIEQRGQHVSQISLTSAVTGMSFIIADAELLVCGFYKKSRHI